MTALRALRDETSSARSHCCTPSDAATRNGGVSRNQRNSARREKISELLVA